MKPNISVANEVTLDGITYKTGDYIITARTAGVLEFGILRFVIHQKNFHEPFFLLGTTECNFLPLLGVYSITESQNEEIVSIFASELYDYYPLTPYSFQGKMVLVLKHQALDIL